MTDRQRNNPWPELPRLTDPLAGRGLPTADDESARALLETITTTPIESSRAHTNRRRRTVLIGAVAAVGAIAFAGLVVLDDDGADAAPLYVAIDRTAELDSGQLEIRDTLVLGDVNAVDATTVRFQGEDEEIVARPAPHRPADDGELQSDGFVPNRIEIRTIEGQSYLRVADDDSPGVWETATYAGPGEFVSFADRLRVIVDGSKQLDTCDADDGVTAYCLSTTSSVDVQPFIADLDFNGTARVRVEIDDGTGLLSSLHIEAVDAWFQRPPGAPATLIYDRVETVWQLGSLDTSWTPEVPLVPDTADIHPRAAEADECLQLEPTSAVDACLADLGLEAVVESGG